MEEYLAYCEKLGWDPNCEISYHEWCYYNQFIKEEEQ
jgi:hypothetical protein